MRGFLLIFLITFSIQSFVRGQCSFTLTTAVTNAPCNGSQGSATVTASGGTAPYSYTWSSGPTSSVEPTLLPGTYTVRVTDATPCSETATVIITGSLTASTATRSPLCNGNNGSATVTAFAGTAPYTYTWSSGPTSSVEPTLLAGTYTVKVIDATACSVTKTVTITQPSALVTSTAATIPLCNGAQGSATATTSGGTPPYTYTWSSGPTSSIEPTLFAGTYTVKITDANNCNHTKSVTITQPLALVASTAVTSVLCFGNSTGAATVTASGGTAGYSYLWSGAQTTSVISGQASGVKTVTITDANSCTISAIATITQPASALSTSTAVTNVLCFGNSTGAATVTASGGAAGYSYLWSGAQTTSVISGQTSGVQTVTVTDANSCTISAIANIIQPASALSTSTAVTNVLCFGNSTGAATVTASGGVAGYSYLWSGAQTTSVVSGQTAGVKTVTITDANSCTISAVVTITQPASALSTSTAVTNVLCFGNSTGATTITASGGVIGYTYLWSSAQTTSVISGLNAGVRTVTVTDANGCTRTNTVTISQPASALVTLTVVTNVLCFGNPTGAATVIASGGTTGYTYLWSSAQTSSVISGLNAGVRTVTVTDANGCISTNTVTITQPPSGITTSTAVTNVLCFGNSTGSATITPSGGIGPYSYLWSTAGTASVISGLNAGVTTVTVTDASGCTSTNTVTITQPAALTLTITSATATVCAGSAILLTANVAGGTGAITYTWSNGPNTTTISVNPITSTSYSLNISDANGCAANANTTVTAIPLPTISANSGTICSGNSFTITLSGANSYTVQGGSSIVSPSTNTTYTVVGISAAGCVSANNATSNITVYSNPTITVNTGTICLGNSFTITPSGANTYTIQGGNGVVSPTTNATYTVVGTGSNGCISVTSATTNVTVYTNPTITVNSGTICNGSSFTITPGGANTYTIQGGSAIVSPVANTSYTVVGTSTTGCVSAGTATSNITVNATPTIVANNGSICTGQSFTIIPSGANAYTIQGGSSVVSPTANSNYTVVGTGTNGCLSANIATCSINVNTNPTIAVSSGTICDGSSFTINTSGANTYTIQGGSAVVTPTTNATYTVVGTGTNGCLSVTSATSNITVYSKPTISVNSGAICKGSSFTITPGGANTYTVQGGIAVVSPAASTSYTVAGTSTAGCVSTNMATSNVTVNLNPVLNVGNDIELNLGSSYQFNPTQTGAVSYTWSPGDYLDANSIISPITTPQNDITYTLTVQSANGCLAIDDINVKVIASLVIANYMSPNGDGQNDTWKVSAPLLIKDYGINIIDGYGRNVFSKSKEYNNEFDGKLNGEDLPDGTYYYFIKDGNNVKYKGSITITK